MFEMKIAFHVNQFSLRGTEVATYDYARYTQELLGHEAVIIYSADHPESVPEVMAKFAARFELVPTADFSAVDAAIRVVNADLLYMLKDVGLDSRMSREVPTAIHAVFGAKPRHIHGDRFAFVSEWLSAECTGGRAPFVPHMIDLPDVDSDLRVEFGIPSDAMVFGNYGGADSFDLALAREALRVALDRRSDCYFLFMNIPKFIDHPRAIFAPGSSDLVRKVKFINTCDAMLYARVRGESFGIACGEFSSRNKPVIAYARPHEASHLAILGDAAILYKDGPELVRLLCGLGSGDFAGRNWDRYSAEFAPDVVIRQFSQMFVEGKANYRPPANLMQRLAAGWTGARKQPARVG
jgi:hypothetical protein